MGIHSCGSQFRGRMHPYGGQAAVRRARAHSPFPCECRKPFLCRGCTLPAHGVFLCGYRCAEDECQQPWQSLKSVVSVASVMRLAMLQERNDGMSRVITYPWWGCCALASAQLRQHGDYTTYYILIPRVFFSGGRLTDAVGR